MSSMSIVLLLIGTVLTLLFVIFLMKGQKYAYMLEALDGDDFPLKSIYCAGLAMQDVPMAALNGKLGSFLRDKTKLIYTKKYSEFYSRIVWAQALSFGFLFGGICFLLGGMFKNMSALMCVLGVLLVVMPGAYFINHVGDVVNKRRDNCDREFPNAISKMALIVNSGVILHDAWEVVAYGNTGEFYELMQKACQEMKNGKPDVDAIYEFGVSTSSDDIKKFCSALIQSIERGGGELPRFLTNQSQELWSHRRQVMLQKGEKAAGALLMPIAMMFAGVMLIVIAAALQSFSM